MDIRQYWKAINEKASELDPESAIKDRNEMDPIDRVHLKTSKKEVFLVSVDNPEAGSKGGRVTTAHPYVAAQFMQARTHVLASPAQIEAHKAELEQRRLDIAAEERKRIGSTMPPEMVELAKAASIMAANIQQNPQKQRGNQQ